MSAVAAIRWSLTAGAVALAAGLVVHYPTPIDQALPFLAAIVTLLAALSYPAVMASVPLLLAIEMAVPDETLRLALFGLVMAASFFVAVVAFGDRSDGRRPRFPALAVALSALVLLRWIPIADTGLAAEILLLVLAAGIVVTLGSTPFAVAVAVGVALFTHLPPGRSLWFPIAVLFAAGIGRIAGVSRIRIAWPSAFVVSALVLFFAWSGVVAKAPRYLLMTAGSPRPRVEIGRALTAGQGLVLEVPRNARSLVLTATNASMLSDGVVLGRVDTGSTSIPVTIGSVADWGYMRREHFAGARNPLPDDPAGTVQGWGYAAWVHGAGRIALPDGTSALRITADRRLAPGVTLLVERFELKK